MAVFESQHPMIKYKLTLLRDDNVSHMQFRQLVSEIGSMLMYELTSDLFLRAERVETWQGDYDGEVIDDIKPTFVPILRAGLGLLDGALNVLPTAKISVVGFYRDESTLQPIGYYEKLAPNIKNRLAIILDPMLATGGSLLATIELLKKSGCTRIKGAFLVAAPEGIQTVVDKHPDVSLHVAAVDEKLNESGYIIPGLGDAGDKIFGTR